MVEIPYNRWLKYVLYMEPGLILKQLIQVIHMDTAFSSLLFFYIFELTPW